MIERAWISKQFKQYFMLDSPSIEEDYIQHVNGFSGKYTNTFLSAKVLKGFLSVFFKNITFMQFFWGSLAEHLNVCNVTVVACKLIPNARFLYSKGIVNFVILHNKQNFKLFQAEWEHISFCIVWRLQRILWYNILYNTYRTVYGEIHHVGIESIARDGIDI